MHQSIGRAVAPLNPSLEEEGVKFLRFDFAPSSYLTSKLSADASYLLQTLAADFLALKLPHSTPTTRFDGAVHGPNVVTFSARCYTYTS